MFNLIPDEYIYPSIFMLMACAIAGYFIRYLYFDGDEFFKEDWMDILFFPFKWIIGEIFKKGEGDL